MTTEHLITYIYIYIYIIIKLSRTKTEINYIKAYTQVDKTFFMNKGIRLIRSRPSVKAFIVNLKYPVDYTLFHKPGFFSTQLQCCLTLSWIEPQILLKCCLLFIDMTLPRDAIFFIFVSMFTSRSIDYIIYFSLSVSVSL